MINKIAAKDTVSISPFSAPNNFHPARFTMENVEQLLIDLLADRPGAIVGCTTSFLAEQIMACTSGHRGLVGGCLSELDLSLIRNRQPVTKKAWSSLAVWLPSLLGGGGTQTYRRMLVDLINTQDEDGVMDIMTEMLFSQGRYELRGADEVRLPDGTLVWELLVWSGVALGPDNGYIYINSPLLLNALTLAATFTGAPLNTLPVPSILTSWSMGDWLLVEGLRHMSLQRLSHAEVHKCSDFQNHEWAISYNIVSTIETAVRSTARLRALLALPGARQATAAFSMRQQGGTIGKHPSLMATTGTVGGGGGGSSVKSKAGIKELDWLWVNGKLPKVGFEVMVLDRSDTSVAGRAMLRHLENCRAYTVEHDTPVFLISVAVMPPAEDQSHQAKKERKYGRESNLQKYAERACPREAAAFVEEKGGDINQLSQTECEDLQTMLDMFPPYLERLLDDKGEYEVWPVDVLVILEESVALVRHNSSWKVHRLELLNTCGERKLRFDTTLLDSMPRTLLVSGAGSIKATPAAAGSSSRASAARPPACSSGGQCTTRSNALRQLGRGNATVHTFAPCIKLHPPNRVVARKLSLATVWATGRVFGFGG